ncbi:MAG: cytochrome c [Saprospiraceae bacterium]
MKYAIGAILGILVFAWLFSVCSPAGRNKTGHEYMPDMYHPVSFETNLYSAYKWNHWDNESVFTAAEIYKPRHRVDGTIPRGMTGVYYAGVAALDVVRGKNAPNAIAAPVNGAAPFYYEDTEEDRTRCEAEMKANPFPITKEGLERGKNLYEINCAICHSSAGDGQGWLVVMPDSKYPAQPKNLLGEDMVSSSNGRYYFAIMYGKNVMGAYKDKMSFEERWQVIHYIRSLQAKNNKVEYTETTVDTTKSKAATAKKG